MINGSRVIVHLSPSLDGFVCSDVSYDVVRQHCLIAIICDMIFTL